MQKKEFIQEQIADAEKLCQLKQRILVTEWPLVRTMFMAYMDGIGLGLQLSKQEDGQHEQASCNTKTISIQR